MPEQIKLNNVTFDGKAKKFVANLGIFKASKNKVDFNRIIKENELNNFEAKIDEEEEEE